MIAPTAVIFDLDGTLIDSEPVYRITDPEFLSARGITLSDDEWGDVVGMGGSLFIEYARRYGLQGSESELLAEKDELYLRHAAGRTRVFPAVLALMFALHRRGIPLAVATASRRRVMVEMLTEVGLADASANSVLAAAVSSDDVENSKPEPDLFLEAARRLGVPADQCLVIEDSQHGVVAARRAGMRVVALPAPGTEHKAAFAHADLVVSGGAAAVEVGAILERFWDSRHSGGVIDDKSISLFASTVRAFSRVHRRDLAWRRTTDPYAILVSEIMLQQTQIQRVTPKYERFLERFPTITSLASAPFSEVLRYWQGLGYNRRGKYLHDAARIIVDRFAGTVPAEISDLQQLPGVGPYTAAAIAVFAYGRPVVMIETNIRRVFLHFFFNDARSVHDREIVPLIERTLDRDNLREWYYALMDYGAHLRSLVTNPNSRSAHYQKQSRFAGSVRQVRGVIIRLVNEVGEVHIDELRRDVDSDLVRFKDALAGLQRDGMLEVHERVVRLPR